MPNETAIEWTATDLPDGTRVPGFTSNPLKYREKATGRIVWACVKHSLGCVNCYAETLAKRFGRGGSYTKKVMETVEPFMCEKELKAILTSKKIAGRKVFIGDMTDVFGEWVTDDMLNAMFTVLEHRNDVIFQLLTKRADRLQKYLSWRWGEGRIPSRHIHVGVSVENQAAADERIPHLLATPAAVRFLSCEPLLESVNLRLGKSEGIASDASPFRERADLLHWIIVGGESGSGSRACCVEWIRNIVKQGEAADVATFVKQLGSASTANYYDDFREEWESQRGLEWPSATDWNDRDGQPPLSSRVSLPLAKKGGVMAEFPRELQVREFPTVPT